MYCILGPVGKEFRGAELVASPCQETGEFWYMTGAVLKTENNPGILNSSQWAAAREQATGYLYILPATVLIFCFGLFPAGYAIYMSMRRWRVVDRGFVGIENYADALGNPAGVFQFVLGFLALIAVYYLWTRIGRPDKPLFLFGRAGSMLLLALSIFFITQGWKVMQATGDDRFLDTLPVTFYFAFGSIPLQLAISLGLAYVLFQKIKGQEVFRIIFFLPYITPVIATALVFRNIFSPREVSLVNRFVTLFEFEPQRWLFESDRLLNILFGTNLEGVLAGPSLALVSIILFGIWTYVGYNTVIFLAGLGGIDRVFYEAAEIDGANRWHQLRFITVPLLSPITFYLSMIGFINTFKAFNHIYVMLEPSAQTTVVTTSVNVFNTFYKGNQFGYASAQAVLLLCVILYLTFVQARIFGEKVFYG